MVYNINKQILLILFLSMANFACAFDLDETVDDEIRKNYNSTQLIKDTGLILEKNIKKNSELSPEETLPELPNITKYNSPKKESDVKNNVIQPTIKPITYRQGSIKIKKGTSFEVNSASNISDWQVKGTRLKFTTKKNIYGKGYSIPANTSFQGEIIESHKPQLTCNGGLVVIRIDTMLYKGQTIPIAAYVTRANDKKIFFNNIKGKRTYLKTMWNKGDWGRTLFNKMLNLTISLGAESSTLVLSPFPITYGAICLGANTIVSPITAFFSKGGHVSIPAGSVFRIKLLDDTFVN